MVFSSYVFIFAFLPVVLSVYYALSNLKNGIYQRLFLIAASLFFYGYYNTKYLILITASIAVNYGIALAIQTHRAKAGRLFLVVGILFNVGLIGYFKYYDFFVENINAVFGCSFTLRRLLLPLGISFFTFQQLSFLISVWRGEEKVERFRDYCIFVTFFPQLVAGPIVLYSEMIPQFRDERRRFFHPDRFASGIWLFTVGLFKKAVIADTLALFADNGFGMTGLGLAAGLFNVDIPFNFRSPYRSESISEFWRRWHITLGRALSTYVYKPLGGNRRGLARTCLNLFLTFLVSGLWHGAAWTFVLWGALHGLFVVTERILDRPLKKIPKPVRVCGTFLVVTALWVLFRADRFGQALEVWRGMVAFGNPAIAQLNTVVGTAAYIDFPLAFDCVYILILEAVLLFVVFRCPNSCDLLDRFRPSRKTMSVAAVLFVIALLCLARESVFIYFNF